MAASETVRLRLQFDYPPPATPHCMSFWLLIDLNRCRVVTDLISLIRQRFGFSSGALLGLYLEGGLLPPAESARLVRDNDCLRCAGGMGARRWGAGDEPAHVRGRLRRLETACGCGSEWGSGWAGGGLSNCTSVNPGDSDWSSQVWGSGVCIVTSILPREASNAEGWWTTLGKTLILGVGRARVSSSLDLKSAHLAGHSVRCAGCRACLRPGLPLAVRRVRCRRPKQTDPQSCFLHRLQRVQSQSSCDTPWDWWASFSVSPGFT